MLIGLSLSFCVADIVRGNVRLEEVAYIISGTNIPQDAGILADWIESMCRTYWRVDPEYGKYVFGELWDSGRVLQPRAQGGRCLMIAAGHWLECTQVYKPQPATPNHSDFEYA